MNKYGLMFLGILVFGLLTRSVWAYDLTLTSVGTQSTLGTDYSVVNFSGGIPALAGTASPSAQVGVKIKTLQNYTTASTSGVWRFVPTALDTGDNLVVITSGTQNFSFTLRFNATTSATVATPAAIPDEFELPDAGVWEYYLPVIAAGLGVFFVGRWGKSRMQKWDNGG